MCRGRCSASSMVMVLVPDALLILDGRGLLLLLVTALLMVLLLLLLLLVGGCSDARRRRDRGAIHGVW